MCKTLQNSKALAATTLFDGIERNERPRGMSLEEFYAGKD